MAFTYPESLSLGRLPTPIEKLTRLSGKFGANIYVKRDDTTGCIVTGNKIRKMEFLAADALKQRCDTFITCGGGQSNHARTVAAVATRLGMKTLLVLRKEQGIPDGNYLLDLLLGAQIQWVTPEEYEGVNSIMEHCARKLEREGQKAYIIPVGGSNEMGSFGYIRCAEEIVRQEEEIGIKFDAVICACGSGGTHEGLFLGKKIFCLDADIISYNVGETPEFFKKKIPKIVDNVINNFDINIEYDSLEIDVRGGYAGPAYGISTDGCLQTIKDIATLEGLILEPIYTAKAMHGLIDEIKKGIYKPGLNILFIHTGGIFGLFPRRGELFGQGNFKQ